MKQRMIMKSINWNSKISDTIHILAGGEVYAMNTLREASDEDQVKIIDVCAQIISAPEKSELRSIVAKQLGSDYMIKIQNVYKYGVALMDFQNMRA